MVMLVFGVVLWLVAGWKVGLALAVGVCLEGIEAMVLLRAVSRLRREKAELVNVLNGVAGDLERAVEEVDSCFGSDSQAAQERQG
jgi:6-phosphogluconate dehydrogenase